MRNLIIRFLLRFCPSMLELQCTACGKSVAPSNVDGHNAYFHPGRVMAPEDLDNARKLSKASLR